jgi:hypothetical protein
MQLDQRDDGNAIQDELSTLTGGRSVPRVFINQVRLIASLWMHLGVPCVHVQPRREAARREPTPFS